VLQVEFLGHELLAHVVLGDAARAGAPLLVARLGDGPGPEAGASVGLDVDPEGLQLFGPDGAALGAPLTSPG